MAGRPVTLLRAADWDASTHPSLRRKPSTLAVVFYLIIEMDYDERAVREMIVDAALQPALRFAWRPGLRFAHQNNRQNEA